MLADLRERPRTVFWHGTLIFFGALVAAVAFYAVVQTLSWGASPRWQEAHRDRWKIPNLAQNMNWFWIHEDSQYWIVRLRFEDGPVVFEGTPPPAQYWSFEVYGASEPVRSLNMTTVVLEDDGTYRVVYALDDQPGEANFVRVPEGTNRAFVELRYTIHDVNEPVILPTVLQGGTVLVEGGEQ